MPCGERVANKAFSLCEYATNFLLFLWYTYILLILILVVGLAVVVVGNGREMRMKVNRACYKSTLSFQKETKIKQKSKEWMDGEVKEGGNIFL